MAALPSTRRYGPDYTPPMVAAIASATAAIARLDARICVSCERTKNTASDTPRQFT